MSLMYYNPVHSRKGDSDLGGQMVVAWVALAGVAFLYLALVGLGRQLTAFLQAAQGLEQRVETLEGLVADLEGALEQLSLPQDHDEYDDH